ncbi:unnamed protein product [Pieris macdunnoughi]|uniref:Uncharacterized protein n=1 Tax=Pieris macdunnoughi TaxID=345717 RepID=A0A821UFC8_9NEOP|nr:unnamed protein product [Pieris macdunnoughi]
MFYILASRLQQKVLNLKEFTLNYSESGHGKGAPDGIGATCKRTADAVVATGSDIDSLESTNRITLSIDTEEGELTVTFLKICDDIGHTIRVDENDVSDVPFDRVLNKLPNPDIALKGKRIFYYFNIPVPVFEK